MINDGQVELVRVYREHQTGVKASDDTIFNVASITKPVVAAAVLKRVDLEGFGVSPPEGV